MPTPISTPSNSWVHQGVIQGVSALSGKNFDAYTTSVPCGGTPAPARWVAALTADAGSTVSIKAYAKGDLDEEVLFRIWLVFPLTGAGAGYTLTYVGTVRGRLSDTTRQGTGIFTGTNVYRLIDNWTIIDDGSLTPPGMRLVGAGGDSSDGTWAELQFDGQGPGYLVVEPNGRNSVSYPIGLLTRYF